MNSKYLYGAVGAAVVVIAAGAWFWSGQAASPLSSAGGSGQNMDLKSSDMVHGSPNAPITMVEYASMTCPHCAAFQKEVVPKLTKDYVDSGKVKMVFREYPLDGAARMASAVARCLAGDQYFSFIDLLFANQMNWIKDFDGNGQLTKEDIQQGLEQMGRFAGMAKEKVDACADSKDNLALVDANWMEGQTKYNVNSTPTFFINGVKHEGEIPYDELKKDLDSLLKK
jgi:protein-disulfide isomerase